RPWSASSARSPATCSAAPKGRSTMARADTAALALILAGGLLATPAPGGSQALPDGDYFVKNNSSDRLRCRYKVGEGRWRSAFTFRPGAEFKLAWRPERDEVL